MIMMIKECKKCGIKYEAHSDFIVYCSTKCKSRDRFLEIKYGNKNFKVWKDNTIKYPDFYNNIKEPKDRFNNKCLNCGNEFIGFRKCCSDECSAVIKRETTLNSTGASHNLSNNSKSRKDMEKKLFENYGVRNVFQRSDVKEKLKKTWIEKYGFTNPTMSCEIKNKVRKTNIDNGNWLSDLDTDEFAIYCYHVNYFTNHNINKFAWKYWGPDFYKNWSFDRDHLDHIYSKKAGFLEKIPPNIIGSFVNLRMIDGKINMAKGIKCDIDKQTLYKNYEEFHKNNTDLIENINIGFDEVLKYKK